MEIRRRICDLGFARRAQWVICFLGFVFPGFGLFGFNLPAMNTSKILKKVKLKWMTAFFMVLVFTACSVTKKKNSNACQAVIDSARAYMNTNIYGINTRPSLHDPKRNAELEKWLQQRTFNELRCLLDNTEPGMIVTGFPYAAVLYNDSLRKYYSFLLKDTTTIHIIDADNGRDTTEQLGKYILNMYLLLESGKKYDREHPATNTLIPGFIRKYAAWPDSYHPATLTGYFTRDDSLSDYYAEHDYEIKNNNGEIKNVTTSFLLNHQSVIIAVKDGPGNYNLNNPGGISLWLKEYGRKLNKKDSVELGI